MGERKTCSHCHETKTLDAFYRKLGQPTSWCKACILADQRDRWRARHPAAPPYVPPTEKRCGGCGEIKPIGEFHRHTRNKDGHQARCKTCQTQAVVSGYRNNPRKHAAYNREWAKRNPVKISDAHLRRRLGLAPGTYDQMLAAQNGRCAICGTDKPNGKGRRFHVDHDANTSVVRGLLCGPCNTGIGQLKHSKVILLAAMNYLENFS